MLVRDNGTRDSNQFHRIGGRRRLSAFIGGFKAFCITTATVVAFSVTAAPITLTDDLGRKVELQAPAQRIVTLAPSLTELVFAAGAGAQLVGVSAHSDYPEQAKSLPQVAMAGALSIEPLVALQPDLILAWRDSIRPEDLERLATFGLPVFVTQAKRLDDVPRLLELIGQLTARDVSTAASGFRRRVAEQRERRARLPRLTVVVEIWHRPLTIIAGPHWMNEMLEACGAKNAFADLRDVAPVVSLEEIYVRNPAVVVGAGSAAHVEDFLSNWKDAAALPAVMNRRLVFVPADLIQRPSMRLADGLAQLCQGLDAVRN